MRIAHNLMAINNYNSLRRNNNNLSGFIKKLSSGLRINTAADDAAGLTISEKMSAQIRGLNMAEKNAQDGLSLVQTADAALGDIIAPPLQRMRELAVQASNGTLSSEDRQAIQYEIDQIKQGIDGIAANTDFNGIKLLTVDNTAQANPVADLQFQSNNIDSSTWIKGISWNGSSYVVIGANSSGGVLLTSSDGATWTSSTPDKLQSAQAVTTFQGKFIIVGESWGIETSDDGLTWTSQNYGGAHYLLSVATNGVNQLIAGGNGGYWTSTDSINWTPHDLNLFNVYDDITWAGDKFVVAKAANPWQISWTNDLGTTWNNVTLPGGALPYGITYGNGTIVAVGQNGRISYSSDANNWTTVQTPTTEHLYDVIWDGSRFLACGENGAFVASTDGANWFDAKGIMPTNETLTELAFTGTKYVAAGSNGTFLLGSSNTVDPLSKTLNLQTGANTDDKLDILLHDARASSIGVDNISVMTQSAAQAAVAYIDSAISKVSSYRSSMGAYENALEHIISNVSNTAENLTAAESRIHDADMAKEVMDMVKSNILVQSSQAMMAQAIQAPQSVLQLLK